MMKFSELKGRAVVDIEDAKKLGEIQDLMVDPDSHRILSLKVKTGRFSAARIVPMADVKNVGADAVTISVGATHAHIPADTPDSSAPGDADRSGVEEGAQAGKAGNTSNGKTESAHSPIEVTSLLHNKVVTDEGTMVGELRDVMVDWFDLTITGYEVREGGLFNKPQEFADGPEVRYGGKLITIPAQLLSHPN